MSKNRPRRSKSKISQPSASHYLGYVEDEETIESIMKKFEAMEEYKNTLIKKENEIKIEEKNEIIEKKDIELDEKHFEDIFKITSSFAVETAIEENNYNEEINYYEEDDDEEESGGILGEQSEDLSFNEDDFFNDDDSDDKKKKKRILREKSPTKRRIPKDKQTKKSNNGDKINNYKKRLTCEVTDENGYKYTVRKKQKPKDPLKEENIRIPKDTSVWAKDILPYDGKIQKIKGSEYMHVENIISIDWSSEENNKNQFLAILMDPPWKCQSKQNIGVDINDIKQINIPKSVLFIFIWTEKEMIPGTVGLMEEWNFNYVENFVWVKKKVNNTFFEQESSYFRKSKLTLLIFRRNSKESVELRHQRNPDVYFDFVRIIEKYQNGKEINNFSSSERESKPLFVYHLVETLLPTGNYNDSTGLG